MTGMMLFCTAQSATEWVRKPMNTDGLHFWVIEFSEGPPKEGYRRKRIADDETIQSDFIGVSLEECRKWALDKQFEDKALDQNIIAIADERSSRDDTILVSFYALTAWDFGGPERVPKEANKWYDFRIHYTEAQWFSAMLFFVNPDLHYRQFFACTEETTDEHGVFHVKEATDLSSQKSKDVRSKNKTKDEINKYMHEIRKS